MLRNASHFNAGEVSQVNAQNYHSRTHGVNVNDGGQYSSNVEIKAGVYYHHEIRSADPLKDLYDNITVGAMHNSDDRADAPKCHEETRKAVQENIFSWMARGDKEGQPKQLLWLTGPAGSGKTAIMGTVSDRLEQMGQLAASFYFASYTGSSERVSKRGFVSTLAYQLQAHPGLGDQMSGPLMTIIRQNPAVFKMNLKEQMEKLILRPLRVSLRHSTSEAPLIIVIDGVDECGENRGEDTHRAREQDQIEVLSVILQALRDASFPCRFIVASRPETWIRRFFTDSAAGHVTEIFLDDSYDPDKDIKLFLDSKLAELGRRYGYHPSMWPREEDVAKLVENASGQFIYAATVIRFIDTPPCLPRDQLGIVLSTKPPSTTTPFRMLDALYTSILKSSASPSETVLWLKTIQRLRSEPTNAGLYIVQPSTWTIDRLFESSPGQAKMLLELPSLVYRPSGREACDACHYIVLPECPNEAKVSYAFYHKSFLDFLEDPARVGLAFPDIDQHKVERWLWGRISRVIECDGPEVPLDPKLLPAFTMCIQIIWALEMRRSGGRMLIQESAASDNTNPTRWLQQWLLPSELRPFRALPSNKLFRSRIFVLVHKNCQPLRPCLPGCKRWRNAIETLPDDEWKPDEWDSRARMLDRFCLKRLPWIPGD